MFTRNKAQLLLANMAMIEAFAEGKTVEFLSTGLVNWVAREEYSFTSPPNQYRIKPEPRTFWVNVCLDGGSTGETIEVQEVLKND